MSKKKTGTALGAVADAMGDMALAGGEQQLTPQERALVEEAYGRLEIWGAGCREMHHRARVARHIALLNDPEQDVPGTPKDQLTLQLRTLKSTINNCIADQMDNMPDARLAPERPELREVADDLSDMVRFILTINDFEGLHDRRVEDFFIAGTAVTQIAWDEEMDAGKGNVAILRWPIEGFLWDPVAEDIQDGRACMKVSWHPLSWYKAHFPDKARFVGGETYATRGIGVPDAWSEGADADEGRAMLLEYWYRKYDADKKRYTIHVAYIAGGALLYASESVKPEGMYAHGRYPFILDIFTRIEGVPAGEGLVQELVPMMRYVNRYCRYIDENLRMASKVKLLVARGSGVDVDALLDMNKALVEGDRIDPDSIREYRVQQFNGAALSMLNQMQADMKQDSGQNQFTRGETAGGVNAASAIAMLQEAGGKISRMWTSRLNKGFRLMVEQIIWLISEYYSEERAYLVTGRGHGERFVRMDRERLYTGEDGKGKKGKDKLPPPPYHVRVQIQRRNPLQIQARNETVMQAYTMFVQSSGNQETQNAFPVSALFEMLEMEGKDEILPLLKISEQKNDVMLQQAQIMASQEQAMAGMADEINNLGRALRGQAQQAANASLDGDANPQA